MDTSTAVTLAPVTLSLGLFTLMHTVFVRQCRQTTLRSGLDGTSDPTPEPAHRPRVSILKPLAGADESLAENLASFSRLTYPDVELLLGVASETDPAAPVARAFLRAYPRLDARLVITQARAAHNPKVAQLIGLESQATGDILVVSDSNVRVPPGYLEPLVAALARPGVAMVSSVIAGVGERTTGAALENLQLMASIAPSIVGASTVCGVSISVGKSMAMHRDALHRVGGFASVGGVLAEDHILGQRFQSAGMAVRLCLSPVQNPNVACTLSRTWERHVRWSRMRSRVCPWGYATEPLVNPLAVATVTALVHPTAVTLSLVAVAAAAHILGAMAAVRVLRGHGLGAAVLYLEPLRAMVSLACWLAGWSRGTVCWRGHAFHLGPGSVLIPVETTPPGAAPDPARVYPAVEGHHVAA